MRRQMEDEPTIAMPNVGTHGRIKARMIDTCISLQWVPTSWEKAPMGSTIWQVMSGNGFGIGTMVIITVGVLSETP